MKCIPLIISFFCLHFMLGAQNPKIDSLLVLIKTEKLDTNKVRHLNKLSREYTNIGNYDEALKYGKLALKYGNFVETNNKIGWQTGIAAANNNIGNVYFYKGDYQNALTNQLAALSINEKTNDKQAIAGCYNSIGAIYWKQGDYPSALKKYLASLEVAQKIQDNANVAKAHNNIGLIYQIQKKYPEALKNYFDALSIKKKLNDKKGIATSHNNIGNVYSAQEKYTEALKNHEIALKLREELGDKQGIVMSHINIGFSYFKKQNYPEALLNYKTALEIAEKINDKYGVSICLLNLGRAQKELHQLNEAKVTLNKALKLSVEIGDKDGIMKNYESLYILDSILGNCESSFMHYKLFTKYKDIIHNEETKKKMVENSMTYEFKQKEAATQAEQDKKDAIAEGEKQRQKTILYFISGGLLLVILLALLIFKEYKQKQKANGIILRQKEEVEKQKGLIEEKNRLVEEKHKEITDSINYAKRIQGALLKEEEHVNMNLPQHFILFMPKDAVSGDFFWNFERKHESANNENKQSQTTEYWYGCVADCTGHGVPGAMMSMLGMGMLSDITGGDTLLTPAEILDRLRSRIIAELGQSGKDGENKDGMDASIFRLNRQTKELYWAGANNSLYLFRNNELTEVKADKQPVAYHPVMKPFTNQVLQLQEGDIYYLITDGYADQFGGQKNKKFKSKQLVELLISIAEKPVKEQKEILKQTFISWKGITEQTDDITIAGLRV